MNECQLEKEPFYQCCCKCVHHLPDYSHPSTDGKSVLNRRGWICAIADGSGIYNFSGWDEHSCGCEMYQTQEQKTEWQRPYARFELLWHVWTMFKLFLGCAVRGNFYPARYLKPAIKELVSGWQK